MPTIRDISALFRQSLAALYDIRETDALSLLVVSEVLEISAAKVKAFPELELTPAQAEKITRILTELQTGKPIQYILGYTEFYGLPFKVNPSVLIPRPETEELVEWAISTMGSLQLTTDSLQLAGRNILDIGTGSGCIAITLKKNLPGFAVSAIDISPEALQTAKDNAQLNTVDVNFIQDDILNPTHHTLLTPRYSLIISNPPYVTLADKQQMHTNVTDFEPHTALFVPEDDPLIFYKAIAGFASAHLEQNGLLFLEINESYGEQTVELLKHNRFTNIELKKDMSGRDRMVKGTRS